MRLVGWITLLSLASEYALGINGFEISKRAQDKIKKEITRLLPKDSKVVLSRFFFSQPVPDHAEIKILGPFPPVGQVMLEAMEGDGYQTSRYSGQVWIEVEAKVAVAYDSIEAGNTDLLKRVYWQSMKIDPWKWSKVISKPEQLYGKSAKLFIPSETMILSDMIETPQVVRYGEWVRVTKLNRNILISHQLKALQGGKVDEWVRLEHPRTKRIFLGKVTAPGQAELN